VQDDGEEAERLGVDCVSKRGPLPSAGPGSWPMSLFKLQTSKGNDIDGNKYCLRILERFDGSHSYENRLSEVSNYTVRLEILGFILRFGILSGADIYVK